MRASVIARDGSPRGLPPPATVWIVDDHPLVASSLADSLRRAGHDARPHPIRFVSACLAAIGQTTGAGLVLLDLELGRDTTGRRLDAVALVCPLQAAGWQVLALTDSTAPARVGAALAAGAAGAIDKTAPFDTLLDVLTETLAGHQVNPAAQRRDLIEQHHRHERDHDHPHDGVDALTAREREILEQLTAGQRVQVIAERYVVSVATVRTQIRAVFIKLGVNSQLEAVAVYSRHRRPTL